MKNSFKFLLFVFAAILIFSCHEKKEKENREQFIIVDSRVDANMQRTSADTLAILHDVNKYLSLLKENKVDSAIEMLYEASADTVLPISKSYSDQVRKTIQLFPVLDYQIDDIKLFSEQDTEVRYTIKYFEKPEGDPRPNTLQCVINPRRVGYYWYLTISPMTYENDIEKDTIKVN